MNCGFGVEIALEGLAGCAELAAEGLDQAARNDRGAVFATFAVADHELPAFETY